MRVLVLALLLLAAGCVAPDEPAPPAEDAATAAMLIDGAGAPPTTGTLVVLTRMPDQTLLAGVNVTVGNVSVWTGVDGLARFESLPPGRVEIEARKVAHRTAQLAVDVIAGEETSTEAVLPADDGDQHAHENGVFAHRDVYTFTGHFDCSATYVIITGDCMTVVDNLTRTAGAPNAPNATQERYLIDFPLDVTWTQLVVELAWSSATPTPATGEGMTLALEPAEAPADGHAVKYARGEGGSPVRVDLFSGIKHAAATAEDMPNPLGGEVIRARAYLMGAGHHPADTDYLGVGAAKDHEFELFVSIFYGDNAPDGYSAIPAG